MDALELLFAAGLAFVAVAAMGQLAWGYLNIPSLSDVPPARAALPRVSIVVAARDEERHVGAAVGALLQQSYPDFELIVVDDRSADRTPSILAELAQRSDRLRVVRVDELPSGWLGKNHAMHVGAGRSSGSLILFADADVILSPEALARAVRLLELERADHLAVAPDVLIPAWPLALVVNYFMMWFMVWLRPWNARKPRSSAFIGIGAFNLVRADVYRAIGGHSRIPLRPDDDLMLGKLIKRGGYRQLFAAGQREVTVEWYRTIGELARGLRKNAFAGLNYSALLSAVAVVGNLALAVWPFAGFWMTGGVEQALYATAALAQMVAYAASAVAHGTRPWLAVLYPVAALIFVAILSAAILRTLFLRRIDWRGTSYSLDQLRANKV